MPRRIEFTLDNTPIHHKGKPLRITKPYTGQNYTSHTVLTDDIFTYVAFFFSTHKKAMKFIDPAKKIKYGDPNQFNYEFYWQQAETFYRAAKLLPIESSPVAAYYCMLNAAKSYISFNSTTADDFVDEFGMHGLNENNTDTGQDLSSISIRHKQKGVFPKFAEKLDRDFPVKWAYADSKSLKSLLYNMPFVHRAFVMTYTTGNRSVEELFLPLNAGDAPKYYKANDGKVYLKIDLEKNYFPPNATTIPVNTLNTISADFRQFDNKGFSLISTTGAKRNQGSISGEIKLLTSNLRKNILYIKSEKRLWYVKRSQSTNMDLLNLSDTTLIMAAMHRISEIARYKPEQLHRLLQSKENWLLHEFITLALDQFIDEIAAEITRQEIMCVGHKAT